MQKIKSIFSAVIGFAGSTENPSQTSMRFMGIITGVISQFSPLLSIVIAHFSVLPAGMTPDQFAGNLTGIIEPIILTIACVMWCVGAVRAAINAPVVAGFLRS